MGVQEYVYNRLQFRYMGQLLLLLQTGKAYGLLPVLVWFRLFKYHSGIFNEDFTFLDTSRVWVFDGISVFDIIRVYIVYPMHEPLYLGKIALVSI